MQSNQSWFHDFLWRQKMKNCEKNLHKNTNSENEALRLHQFKQKHHVLSMPGTLKMPGLKSQPVYSSKQNHSTSDHDYPNFHTLLIVDIDYPNSQ